MKNEALNKLFDLEPLLADSINRIPQADYEHLSVIFNELFTDEKIKAIGPELIALDSDILQHEKAQHITKEQILDIIHRASALKIDGHNVLLYIILKCLDIAISHDFINAKAFAEQLQTYQTIIQLELSSKLNDRLESVAEEDHKNKLN